MSYITSFEYFAERRGIEAGLQTGMQEGLQQGLQEGLQQGLQQGKQEGKQEGKLLERSELLNKLLIKKFEHIPNTYLDKIHSASLDMLSEWIDRWFVSNTIDEIFA